MSNLEIKVPGQTLSYPIKIKKQVLNTVGKEVRTVFNGRKIMIITDDNVSHHYEQTVRRSLSKEGFEVNSVSLEPGEKTKSFQTMPLIYSQLIEAGITRSDLIIALGGGVVGDIAGFVAATFLRGIALVQIPTTLLAQVDSSVGGKVGVDLPEGKNLAGAFYHPSLVLIDPNVLETLSDHYFSDGMAEVIKYGCIKDAGFFHELLALHSREAVMANIEKIIEVCCRLKQEVVEEDEKDRGVRMLLNFGHTLGHAIEAHYQYEKYTHGHAVAIGMVIITQLAEDKGLTDSRTAEQIIACLKNHNLTTALAEKETYHDIIPFISKDKKNVDDHLNLILLQAIGHAKIFKTDSHFFDSIIQGGKQS